MQQSLLSVRWWIHCSNHLFELFSPFALTSTEITTPIRLLFPDILPSKLRSSCFFLFFFSPHQMVSFFCFCCQINIYPQGVRLCSLIFFFSYLQSKSSTNPEIMEMTMLNKHKESVPINTPDMSNCLSSFFIPSSFCSPFVCHCFLFRTQYVRHAEPEGGI